MNINSNDLLIKMRDFWKDRDGIDFTTSDVRSIFSHEEIAFIINNEYLEYSGNNFVKLFIKKIKDLEHIFKPEEAILYIYNNDLRLTAIKCLNDELILSIIMDPNSYEEFYNFLPMMVDLLSSDESKLQAMKYAKDSYHKACALAACLDDKIKLNNLRKIPADLKFQVIASLNDKYLIEKSITLFKFQKGELIKALDDDGKKLHYLKKYFYILSKADKACILASLDDKDTFMKYIFRMTDDVKADILAYHTISFLNEDDILKILDSMKSSSAIYKVISNEQLPYFSISKYIDMITNKSYLSEILETIGDEYRIKYLNKLDSKRRFEIIRNLKPECLFVALGELEDQEEIFKIIDHIEVFPQYKDEYEKIIDMYVNKYQVNKEHLVSIVKNISLSILKVMDNPNIKKILNCSDSEFKIIMEMFDQKLLTMNASSMNDIVNALLQREFRLKYSNIILLFPLTLNSIENGKINEVKDNLSLISKEVNINEELNKNGLDLDKFILLLFKKDEMAIDILHTIISKYIREKRSDYIKENMEQKMESCTIISYDKRDVIKYVLANYPTEYIMDVFLSNLDNTQYMNENEKALINDKELLKEIILYKKNPILYDKIPDNVKEHLKDFYSLFDKFFTHGSFYKYKDLNGKRNYEFKSIDLEFIIRTLMNLDIDKLRLNLFNDKELLDVFMKYWKQYKVGGWGYTFNELFTNAGVFMDSEIVANFIQYFGLSYEELKEKKENKQINNISLTALLDMAACYSTDSKKYGVLFGKEDFKLLASNPGPNAASMLKDKRIDIAIKLLKTIKERKKVTIPPLDKDFQLKNGKMMNVVVGNFSNIMNLTYGERTGACMRIGGAGESLFNFCLENENGFHIRFVNPDNGKFVSRVSGFRNGNTVFLNELRYSEDNNFTDTDVVEACSLVAKELIELSKESTLPIDNVVITPFYAMKNSGMFEQNLGIEDPQKGMKHFYTDVSANSVLLASSNNNDLVPIKLGAKGTPKYDVIRDKKRILYNQDCINFVSHIHCLDDVLGGTNIDNVEVSVNESLLFCLAGEDWYVAIDKNGEVNKYIMNNTNNKQCAIDEMQDALNYLKENINKEMSIAINSSLGM